ncbi:hypothetical protein IQ06DRAFT_311118 [Phaeosphaeriaceae sp. SRC1lsM3a]|nr:hypothetical protein IQ06DRAFT_311118 [Stagonospora sp. SRC1lsM3a]
MSPKLPGKNTATREYYAPNATTDSASDEDIEWPDSLPSSQNIKSPSAKTSPSSSSKHPAAGPERGGEMEEKKQTPSPTPSDIVLNADFRDVGALGEENRRMVEEDVGVKERRRRLESLKAELEAAREKEGKGKEKR